MKLPAHKTGSRPSHFPSRHRGFGRFYTLSLAAWLIASIALFAFVLRTSGELSEHEFKEYADGIHTHLRDKLRANETVLYGFAGFLGAINLDANDNALNSARVYSDAVLKRHPHIHMLEIVRKLPQHELERYSEQLRRTWQPNFRVRQFNAEGAPSETSLPEKENYYPVIFMAPVSRATADGYGLDIDSIDSQKHALQHSEQAGVPVSSAPFRRHDGDVAYAMFRPAISGFSTIAQRPEGVPASIAYAVLMVRTIDLLPSRETLAANTRHTAWHRDFATGGNTLPLFDIVATPASRLETFLLPSLHSERNIDDVSPPLRITLERQLRFSDINTSAVALAGMASILSLAILLAFLRSHDRQHRALEEDRRAIEHLALHDALTALPNRFLMLGHLGQAISLALRHDMKVAVLFLDLDGFKPINDRLGHPAGDIVLKEIARRLQSCVRDCDTAARYGGDEFVMLLTEIWGEENAALVADKVMEAVAQPIQIGNESVRVGTSIGIAIFPNDGNSAEVLIDQADKAMYVAKQRGRGQFAFSGIDLTKKKNEASANQATATAPGNTPDSK